MQALGYIAVRSAFNWVTTYGISHFEKDSPQISKEKATGIAKDLLIANIAITILTALPANIAGIFFGGGVLFLASCFIEEPRRFHINKFSECAGYIATSLLVSNMAVNLIFGV